MKINVTQKNTTPGSKTHVEKHRFAIKASPLNHWFLAAIALLLAGSAYRITVSHLELLTENPVKLPVPLSALPKEIDGWSGKDVAIPEYIQRVAGNDDFLYRLFVYNPTGHWASVYVAYSGRPRTMLGHRPEVCYVAAGWVHEESVRSQFLSSSGKEIPCLINRFYKPGSAYEETVVLSFYILNGQFTCSEKGFSGLGWRTPNIAGNPARYIAQIQISSVLENSVRAAARDITEVILDFLPDEKGKVRAVEYALGDTVF